ncbi:NAD(P)-binding protein [Periconia macrospinosa]|uniref:NAD(P)-binding protein n=1 Tax=Periconia macrospinosa TaxID=97972 RepID=A0A2V1D194_9PLEO|nr:NAD(P)-binding protein [Periconia macrospinosa]
MRVAVAGYGDLSRYICEEFIEAGHELVILTRRHNPQISAYGINESLTDYTLPSLQTALVDCDVLISTISDMSAAYTQVHTALIKACQSSPRCKRFIPAEFAANIESHPDQPGFYYPIHEPIREILRNQTDLEWTLVCIGWLADYFVPTKNRYIKDIGEAHPINWSEDKIVIPGTGMEPVDFTWARDVVKALASLIKAPAGSWEPYTFMSGERSCWNEKVEVVRQMFFPGVAVDRRSLYDIAEMVKQAKDEGTLLLADYYLLSISGACAMPDQGTFVHRQKYFPDVVFRTVKEGLLAYGKSPDSVV